MCRVPDARFTWFPRTEPRMTRVYDLAHTLMRTDHVSAIARLVAAAIVER